MPANQHIKAESVAELKTNAENFISVLTDFGVKGQIIDVSQGPVVTLYELKPAPGTKSNVGVRNIAGYNAKVVENLKKEKSLERVVQNGFDLDTGKPIYESIPISKEKLPFIVVIVDEMADLMIVAKDIETPHLG